MRILEGACPDCGGDIYIDYKHGRVWKCIKCSRVFKPKAMRVVACLKHLVAEKKGGSG